MSRRPRYRSAFSLLELLIVVTLLSIMAAVIVPSTAPSIDTQLLSAAEIVAGDLTYGRSLAVLNNDTYQFLFDVADNQYTLEYSGSNSALGALPPNPFHASQDSATQFVVRLAKLPHIGAAVSLYDVQELTPSPVEVTSVQFGPLGSTTQSPQTVVWLTAATGSAKRFLSLTINPATGLSTVGTIQASAPTTGTSSGPTSGGTTSGS